MTRACALLVLPCREHQRRFYSILPISMILSDERLEAVTQKAVDAFWETIVAEFPQAKTGDLSPLTTIRMVEAMKAAVDEWVWANCP